MPDPFLVWYVAYGSNLSYDRFKCYIQGSKPTGSKKNHIGCEDKTLPRFIKSVKVNNDLYFAGYSEQWKGSTAFMDIEPTRKFTLFARAYLITLDQLAQVYLQENNAEEFYNTGAQSKIIEDILYYQDSFQPLIRATAYNVIIPLYYLSTSKYPYYTVTSTFERPPGKPSKQYIMTIIKGIKEAFPGTRSYTIIKYLQQSTKNLWDCDSLEKLLDKK